MIGSLNMFRIAMAIWETLWVIIVRVDMLITLPVVTV